MAGRAAATARAFLCRSTRRAGHLHRRINANRDMTSFARNRFGAHGGDIERREIPQIAGIATCLFARLRLMRDGFG
jgi:hypothetical protein